MNPIEPNLAALACFAALWSICCLGFLEVAGMYPLGRGASGARRALVVGNSGLWLALVAGTCLFARAELRPTTIIVAGGLLILFLPGLFQSLPRRWRDGAGGLVATAIALCLGIAVLFGVTGTPIAPWF
jgi:membrane-bound metal-dependent hydrolase YbcI (DUF457 family)